MGDPNFPATDPSAGTCGTGACWYWYLWVLVPVGTGTTVVGVGGGR